MAAGQARLDRPLTLQKKHAMSPKQKSALFEISRLDQALTDWRTYPIAYPILTRHGEMEFTGEGWKMLDPETFKKRVLRVIEKLSEETQ